ncbi:unnamed protein product [Cochlearia groenlandica]
MMIKKVSSIVVVIMSFMILLGCSSATVYKVGDSKGWNMKDEYQSLVRNKVFHVGDSLVFDYDQNVNDVTHVSTALDYVSCNSLSPKAIYNTGHDVVTLTEPGHYYFITSNHIQCVNGLKLDVLVVADPSHPIPPPPPRRKVHEGSRSVSSSSPPPPPRKILSPPPPPPRKLQSPPPPPRKILSPPPSKLLSPPPPPKKILSPPPPPNKFPSPPSNTLPSGKLYKVGDSRGWSVYNSFYYYVWSQNKEFYVGDTLLFQYYKNLHDVEEIDNEAEFRSCEPTSTVAVYKTGHDLVKLTKPGVHYFVSMKTGLCTAGIKLRVTVLPLPKDVTTPNVPRTGMVPPFNRRNSWWWLRPFRPPHH